MGELVDKVVGPAEIKIDQGVGTLSLEVDVSQPISIGGSVLGSVTGKIVVQIDELAIAGALAAKYPAAQAVIGFLQKEIQALAPAAPPAAAAP